MLHDRDSHHGASADVVLEVGGLNWATEKRVIEIVLGRRPGVVSVDANAVAQTATVSFDPNRTSIRELRDWIRDCGYHCRGESVPSHICDPLIGSIDVDGHDPTQSKGEHAGHEEAATPSPHEMMGHGGHAGMSMAGMVADMRRRFVAAAALSVPILLWSAIGRDVLNFEVAAPFGMRDDVFQLVLSLPVVGWSAWIFFDGAWRALHARTLDMMVLVAVAVGSLEVHYKRA